jgi:hypothetical protein
MARRTRRGSPARTKAAAATRRSSEVARALAAASEALKDLDGRFALVGGLAVSARSEPRFTADVDLAVSVRDDAQAERLVLGLRDRGWVLRMLIEQKAVGRLGTARFQLPGVEPSLRVDLLFSASGIEPEVVAAATPAELPDGTKVVTAGVGHLIAMKCLSESPQRLQDRIDLVNLVGVARAEDLATARKAVRMISARGLARRKNLERVLDRYVKHSR